MSSKHHPNQGGRSGPACRQTVLCHRSGNSNSSNSPCPNRRRRRVSKALAKRRRAARRRKRRGPNLSRKRAIMRLRGENPQRLRVSSLLRRRRLRRGVLTGEDWRLLPLLLLPRCDHQQQQRHYPLLEVALYIRD